MLNGLDEIEGLTDVQQALINKLAGGLINKKTELEEKLSKAKGSISSEESAQEKLTKLEGSIERERLESKENYQGALEIAKQESTASLEKLTNSNSEKDQLIHKLLVENGLTAELVKLNVNPDLMGLIQQGLSATATVIDGQAMIGDKSLSEYMTEWADTPQGKASRLAPGNSGGEGFGGGNVPAGKKMADMSGQERTALFQQNPTEFNRLKAEMQ